MSDSSNSKENLVVTTAARADVPTECCEGEKSPHHAYAHVPNKRAMKKEKNPDAGVGTQKPAVTRRAAEEDSGPTKAFCGVSARDEKRLYTTFKSRKQLWLAEIAKHSAPIDSRDDADKSNKGYIDTRCLPIMALLNSHEDYVTTSSCSGRICLFHSVNGEEGEREGADGASGALPTATANNNTNNNDKSCPNEESHSCVGCSADIDDGDNNNNTNNGSGGGMKRGAEGSLGWILASHESPLTEDQIQLILQHTVAGYSSSPFPHSSSSSAAAATTEKEADSPLSPTSPPSPSPSPTSSSSSPQVVADVNGCMVAGRIPTKGTISLKCEPFLLHVQCRTIEAAKRLLNAASEAGFRNSGMIPPGKNIMVGIRHASLSIDAPIVADGGVSFASEEYVRFLVKVAEEKMAENFRRTVMLEKSIARWITKKE